MIKVTNPSRLTLGGYPLQLGDVFDDAFARALEPHAPGGAALITKTDLGDEASVLGAVLLGMKPLLADPLG